ncbi:hypothetical protein DK419_25695 [Methylobacterium terrae]|uniref:Uncharacterized protein n=1 Tax=Methylobacterium terrae TaxID=2202827 RepID=A0A2U8WVN5_9HYPH|nr:hypothetical protein DK419_25695 [Methylobacterium terrae]
MSGFGRRELSRPIGRGRHLTLRDLATTVGYLSMAYSDSMLYSLVPTCYMWFVPGGACAALRQRRAASWRPVPLPA